MEHLTKEERAALTKALLNQPGKSLQEIINQTGNPVEDVEDAFIAYDDFDEEEGGKK